MGRWDRVLTFSSLCLSQEKGTEGSGLLLPFGNSFFICALYDYKADESALINTALNWTIVGPFTGFGKAGAHEMWGFWWCHGEGSSLQVCRANTMAVLSFTERDFCLCLGQDRVSNFPQQAMVIPVVLESCVVTKIPFKQIPWLSNTGFDISCSIGNGQSLAKITDISQGSQGQNMLLCVGMLTDFSFQQKLVQWEGWLQLVAVCSALGLDQFSSNWKLWFNFIVHAESFLCLDLWKFVFCQTADAQGRV